MINSNPIEFCKKITYDNSSDEPVVLFGIIISENEFFLNFETKNKIHSIQINRIISIESTNKIFERGISHE